MHACVFIHYLLIVRLYIMDPKDKEQILKTIPAEWHERAHAFFQIASDQNVEWFPQGATTLEKKLISQNIIQQSEMIRLRVTNVFFSFCMQYDCTCWQWSGNGTRMRLAWKKRKRIKARIRCVVSFFVFWQANSLWFRFLLTVNKYRQYFGRWL